MMGLGSEGDCCNDSRNGDVSGRVWGDGGYDTLLAALTVKRRMTRLFNY